MCTKYVAKKKGGRKVFSNSIIKLILFLNNLPIESYQKIIVSFQVIVILAEILSFFYIRYITRNY